MVLSNRDITTYGTTIRIFLLAVVCGVIVSLAPYGHEVFAGAKPTAYFYLEIHTEAIIRNKADFDIETRLLQRLSGMLEKHGARGSFMFLDIYPRLAGTYIPGTETMVSTLEKRGHEIGVHFHPWGPESISIASTIRDIKSSGATGVESLTTSFHRDPVLEVEKVSFDAKKWAFRLENMLGDMYAGGMTSAFRWCMEDTTPYKPRRDNWITSGWADCGREREIPDPGGKIVAVGMYDGAGYTFSEKEDGFTEMLDRVKRTLPKFKNDAINYFPLAVHDYYFLNPSGGRTVNRVVSINEERLAQFDRFLDAIDGYVGDGYFKYGTRRDVTRAFANLEASQGRTEKKRDQRTNVFYILHVHSAAADRPEFVPLSKAEFEGTVGMIKTISRTLESHNARGSFHIMQNFADAAVVFQGRDNNILKDLADRGHEIGAHVHTDRYNQWQRTRDAILAAGLRRVTTISGVKMTSLTGSEAFKRVAELGFTVVTGNNSPLDPFPQEGLKGAAAWGFESNEAYKTAGMFMHPWLPDYAGNSLSKNNPNGNVLYIDTVPPNVWMAGKAPLGRADFGRLMRYFQGADAATGRNQLNTWGFITHETEYHEINDKFHPSNPVYAGAISALDGFLSDLDRYKDRLVWTTPRQIYSKFMTWQK